MSRFFLNRGDPEKKIDWTEVNFKFTSCWLFQVTLYRSQSSKLSEVKEENLELKSHIANLKVLLIEKTENSTPSTAALKSKLKSQVENFR